MPGQQGAGGRQPATATATATAQTVLQDVAQRCKTRPVRPVQLWTGDLTGQHGDLMLQREDLRLLAPSDRPSRTSHPKSHIMIR
jgi:hypothetical protein